MKSKFFKDTQELEPAFESCTPDKISVCLRLDKRTYEHMITEAGRKGISSGEYLEQLLVRDIRPENRLH